VVVFGPVPLIGESVEHTTGKGGFVRQEIFHPQVQIDPFVLSFAFAVLQDAIELTVGTEIMVVKTTAPRGFSVEISQGGKDVELIGPQVEIARGSGIEGFSHGHVQGTVEAQGLFLFEYDVENARGTFRIV